MHTWRFRLLQAADAANDRLVVRLRELVVEAFGVESLPELEAIRDPLRQCTALGLLVADNAAIDGFALYSVPTVPLHGQYLLWEDGIALAKSVQGRGYSSRAFAAAFALFPATTFGWLGGRAQNPVVFRRYAALGRVLPFELGYGTAAGSAVMSYLRTHVAEVRDAPTLEPSTGICRAAYGWAHAPEFPVSVAGVEPFEAWLAAHDFRRSDGDAVVVVSRLREPVTVPADSDE